MKDADVGRDALGGKIGTESAEAMSTFNKVGGQGQGGAGCRGAGVQACTGTSGSGSKTVLFCYLLTPKRAGLGLDLRGSQCRTVVVVATTCLQALGRRRQQVALAAGISRCCPVL